MDLCIAKVPALSIPVAPAFEKDPCPQHVTGAGLKAASRNPAAPVRCPKDDPGAQVRSADVPVAGVALIHSSPRPLVAVEAKTCRGARPTDDWRAAPLYTRLARLLL